MKMVGGPMVQVATKQSNVAQLAQARPTAAKEPNGNS